jgi:DNA helicase-2/ATP-dependent DNA helicase PcrA
MYAPDETNTITANCLDNLNDVQREAVLATEGPLLVLAGAGTGKTRVLTARIAHILSLRLAFPSQILAVTFTNKAAREMRSRLDKLTLGAADGIWLGTFHSIASKILRRHAESIGLNRDFAIIDYDDQIRLAKQILADYNIDDKKNPPRALIYLIGRFKDKAWSVGKVPESEAGLYAGGRALELYATYQARLKVLNAVDFGDLTLLNIELFNKNPDILKEYQNKFKYMLVDEYQDTNVAQYLWLRILAQGTQNICCVGDDDQSIYGWRGAEVTNILRFDKDFADAKIIRLEQNYRSTNNILKAASTLIANNDDRHGKSLWTGGESGNKIKLSSFYDDKEEARYIAEEIESIRYRKIHSYLETAVLVRAGYQTRSFEESFNFLRIPYRIIGGLKFYERAEIRDVLAYIRLLVSPSDSLAFERIINTPRRGIGNGTLQKIIEVSKDQSLSYYESTKKLIEVGAIKGKSKETLEKMFNDLHQANELLNSQTHWQVVEDLLDNIGYIEMWKTDVNEDSRDRIENIKELLRSLQDYTDLREYLEHISLVTDTDNMQDDDKVNIMTIHAAKGLEFETVFLTGWEEGIFPSQKALDENGKTALEEERRLAYVAITRAKNNLYITYACNRRIYGSFQPCIPSRFIDELPKETYEIINNYGSYYNNSKRNFSYSAKESPEVIDASSSPRLKKGQRVFNVKFGYGYILSISNSIAEVAFDKAGIKKVLAEYLSENT